MGQHDPTAFSDCLSSEPWAKLLNCQTRALSGPSDSTGTTTVLMPTRSGSCVAEP